MKARTFSTVLLVGVVALLVAFECLLPLYVIGSLLCLAALREFYKMAENRGTAPFSAIALAFAVLLLAAGCPGVGLYWLRSTIVTLDGKMGRESLEWLGAGDVLTVVFVISVLGLVALKPTKNNPLARAAVTIFGFIYIPFLFGFLLRMVGHGGGLYLAIYVVAVTKSTDIGAYLAGSWIGKHQMSPQSSPKKTWEGFAGGVLVALAVSLGFAYVWLPGLWWRHALALGLILPPVSVVGDLFESVIKRDTAAKDSGAFIPGIGGALDLIDSILFTAPLFYFYQVLFGL